MSSIILVAESGSDITKEMAARYNIEIVPMHVNFGEETADDGTFPAQQIVDYYRTTGTLPKTSGSTPEDFMVMFDKIHADHPDAQILYLAYSAVTTCSYQSAIIASEDRDYVTAIDTKQVSAGQGILVVKVAQELEKNPDMTLEEAVALVNELVEKTKMCFMPDNLEFLRAGGRVSNAAYLGSRILNIHPLIEILDGKLTATKKYRGKMTKVAKELIKEYAVNYNLGTEELWLIHTVGLTEKVKAVIKDTLEECGFNNVDWVQCHGVITTHGGPAAFGIAGFAK